MQPHPFQVMSAGLVKEAYVMPTVRAIGAAARSRLRGTAAAANARAISSSLRQGAAQAARGAGRSGAAQAARGAGRSGASTAARGGASTASRAIPHPTATAGPRLPAPHPSATAGPPLPGTATAVPSAGGGAPTWASVANARRQLPQLKNDLKHLQRGKFNKASPAAVALGEQGVQRQIGLLTSRQNAFRQAHPTQYAIRSGLANVLGIPRRLGKGMLLAPIAGTVGFGAGGAAGFDLGATFAADKLLDQANGLSAWDAFKLGAGKLIDPNIIENKVLPELAGRTLDQRMEDKGPGAALVEHYFTNRLMQQRGGEAPWWAGITPAIQDFGSAITGGLIPQNMAEQRAMNSIVGDSDWRPVVKKLMEQDAELSKFTEARLAYEQALEALQTGNP